MPKFTIPVRFSGRIEYQITAETEQEAMQIAETMAQEEANLGNLEDIDWTVKPATDMAL